VLNFHTTYTTYAGFDLTTHKLRRAEAISLDHARATAAFFIDIFGTEISHLKSLLIS
jgi:hypothetical protein